MGFDEVGARHIRLFWRERSRAPANPPRVEIHKWQSQLGWQVAWQWPQQQRGTQTATQFIGAYILSYHARARGQFDNRGNQEMIAKG